MINLSQVSCQALTNRCCLTREEICIDEHNRSHQCRRASTEGDNPGECPAAIMTVSDPRTPEMDTSGQLIRTLAETAGHQIVDYRIVKDEPDQVAKALEDSRLAQHV